jgi:hypothetical protein
MRRLLLAAWLVTGGCYSTCDEPNPPAPSASSQAQNEGPDANVIGVHKGPFPLQVHNLRVHAVQPLPRPESD